MNVEGTNRPRPSKTPANKTFPLAIYIAYLDAQNIHKLAVVVNCCEYTSSKDELTNNLVQLVYKENRHFMSMHSGCFKMQPTSLNKEAWSSQHLSN